PCANAGEISTMVSNSVFGEAGSISSRPCRSFGFAELRARFAKRGEVVREPALDDRGAQLAHERLIVVQVVQGVEACPEDLVHLLEMMQIAARKVLAGGAGAGLIERA